MGNVETIRPASMGGRAPNNMGVSNVEIIRGVREFVGELDNVKYKVEFECKEGHYCTLRIHRYTYLTSSYYYLSTLDIRVEEADERKPAMLCITSSYFTGDTPEPYGGKVCVDATHLPFISLSLLHRDAIEKIENLETLMNYIVELSEAVVNHASNVFAAIAPEPLT